MTDIAKHIRVFNPSPDDDFVSKRTTVITQIEAAIKKKSAAGDLIKFANELLLSISNPNVSNIFITQIAEAPLKKQSTSFVADGENLQMLTCTILATIQFLEKRKSGNSGLASEDILAVALWNGLSYQISLDIEKLETLRGELLAISQKIVSSASHLSRQRKDTLKRDSVIVPSEVTSATIVAYISSVDASYVKLVDALRCNALLDREELDILWWVLGGWSSFCKMKILDMNNIQLPIVSSLEIVNLLRRLPTEAHAHIACQNLSSNETFEASEICTGLDQLLPCIAEKIRATDVSENVAVFPMFNMLTGGNNEQPSAKIKRPLIEWVGRCLFEGSLANLNKFTE